MSRASALALALLCASFPNALLAAPDIPAIMILTGRIAPGTGLDSTSPQEDDQVLAFSAMDGQLVGSGPVSSNGGNYMLVISRTASFNGVPVVLELMQGRRRYQLLHDAEPAWLPFKGTILPERTTLSFVLGTKTAELEAEEAALPRAQRLTQRPRLPCDAAFDVRSERRCDQQDWDVFKLYRGGVARSVAHPD